MYRVIVVDDELLVRKRICIGFDWAGMGFEIADDADDGVLALEMILKNHYDLAVVDIAMPGMNGIELVRRLREAGNPIRIIFLTGHSDFGYAKEAIRYGVISYILKPVNEEEFIDTLHKIRKELDRERLNERLRAEMARKQMEMQLFMEFRFFSELLSGTLQKGQQSAVLERALSIGLKPDLDYVLITCKSPEVILTEETDLYQTYQRILAFSAEVFGDTGYFVFLHLLDDTIVFYINHRDPGKDGEAFAEMAAARGKSLCLGLSGIFGKPCSFGVSGRKSDFLEINAAYRECLDALKMSLVRPGSVPKKKDIPLVAQSCEYLQQHSSDNMLTQAEVADALGVTSTYLSTLFKKSMGVSMMNYLTMQRLENARRMLMEDAELPLRVIAEKVGYSDEFYFSRSFKKYFGMSPSQLRREGTDE